MLAAPAAAQQATRLVPRREVGNLGYGASLAMSGTRFVVGAPRRDGTADGAVYLYTRFGNAWVEEVRLSVAGAGPSFGTSVAIDGDFVVVGAPAASGGQGAAYVFWRNGGVVWQRRYTLVPDGSSAGMNFGQSVGVRSTSNGQFAVGAPGAAGGAGAVYLFSGYVNGEPASLSPDRRLDRPTATQQKGFGRSVALSTFGVLVGALQSPTDPGEAFHFNLSNLNAAPLPLRQNTSGTGFGISVGYISIEYVISSLSGAGLITDSRDYSPDEFLPPGNALGTGGGMIVLGDDATGRVSTFANFIQGSNGLKWQQRHVLSDPAIADGAPAGAAVATDGSAVLLAGNGKLYVFENQALPDEKVVAFGIVGIDTSAAREVPFSATGIKGSTITRWISRNPQFTVETPTPLTVTGYGHDRTSARIRFTPTQLGEVEGYLVYEHGSTAMRDSVLLRGTSVSTRINASSAANIGNTNFVGSPKSATVSLQATGRDLTVTRVTSRDAGLLVKAGSLPFTVRTSPTTVPLSLTPIRPGSFDTYVVFEHDGTSERDSVRVTGSASYPALTFSPSLISFNTAAVEGQKETTLRVSAQAPVVVIGITSREPAFTVDAALPDTMRPGQTTPFTVRFRPTEARAYDTYLRFERAGGGRVDSVRVTGTGVVGGLAFAPDTLDLGRAFEGQTRVASLTLTATGVPVRVTGIAARHPAFSVSQSTPFVMQAGQALSVSARFTPPAALGRHESYVVVEHDGPGGRDSVLVVAQAAGRGLEPTTAVVDFGSVRNGGTSARTLTMVARGGTVPLTVTRAFARDTAFTVTTALPVQVNVNGSRSFTLRFAPPRSGAFRTWVVFEHSGTPGRDSVEVVGEGLRSRLIAASALTFLAEPGGVPDTTLLTLTVEGLEPVTIHATRRTDTTFALPGPLPVTVRPGTPVRLPVTFAPGEARSYSGRMTLLHDGDGDSTRVTLSGTGREVLLVPGPTALTFPVTATGSSSSAQLSLASSGPRTVRIARAYTNHPSFSIDAPLPFVANGASMRVRFSPVIGGPATGYLYFEHDGTRRRDSVRVSGQGHLVANVDVFETQRVLTNYVNVLFRITTPQGRGLNIPTRLGGERPGPLHPLRERAAHQPHGRGELLPGLQARRGAVPPAHRADARQQHERRARPAPDPSRRAHASSTA